MENKNIVKKSFFKRSKRGHLIKICNEKYLSHHQCGYVYADDGHKCITSDDLRRMIMEAPHKQLIVIDTNIALHQIDVLEHDCPATSHIVITQTLLQELRHLNISIYKRLLQIVKDQNRSCLFYPNELSIDTAVNRLTIE